MYATDDMAPARGRRSREKGKRGEREIARILREHGYKDARRGVQYSGRTGAADVVGIPGWHIEVKRVEYFDMSAAVAQARSDAHAARFIPDDHWVVMHRSDRKPWIAIMAESVYSRLITEKQVQDAGYGADAWQTEISSKSSGGKALYEALDRARDADAGKHPLVRMGDTVIMYMDDFLAVVKNASCI